jgi:hypothetical protein
MTNQPAPGDEGTPNGYQPPSYIPPQGSQMPPPNADHGQPPTGPNGSGPYGTGQYGTDQYGNVPYGNGSYGPGQYGPGHRAGPYGPAYGTTYGQPSYYGMPPEPKGLSIASLCCGIAVFLGLGIFILPQIAAVVLGHLALLREPAGRGLAIAGLLLGYLGLAMTAIVLTFIVVAIFARANSGYGY